MRFPFHIGNVWVTAGLLILGWTPATAGPAHAAKGAAVSAAESMAVLRSPIRLTEGRQDEICVSDYRNKAVYRLSQTDLGLIATVPIPGNPLGVAWCQNRLYVGNETRGRVEVYDAGGTFLYDLGKQPEEVFKKPTDIAVDDKRQMIFVVDGVDKTIKVFDRKGAFIRLISGPGTGDAQLANPTAIAVDPVRSEVFASDYGEPQLGVRPRVQIFDYDGNHLGQIKAKVGMLGLRFSRPQGLAVDGQGHVFLVDALLGQVLVFDRNTGALVKEIGSFGTDAQQLLLPLDVVIADKTFDLFVTNNRPGRIEVFQGGGRLP